MKGQKIGIFLDFRILGRKISKQIELSINNFWSLCRFFKNFVGQGLELEFGEEGTQFFLVGFAKLQRIQIEFNRNVGSNRREEFRHPNIIDVRLYFLAQFSFDLVGMSQKIVDVAKLLDEFHGGFLANARTAREIVRRVAHQRQKVDDLVGIFDAIFRANLLRPHFFVAAAVTRTELENVVTNELSVVLVRCQHIGFNAHFPRFHRECANHVVGLEPIDLQARNVPRLKQLLDDWHRAFDVLGRFLALCFVLGKSLVAECFSVVESHADMRRLFLGDNLVKRVHKAHHSRCIQPFRVDARVLDESVIRAVNQRVSVE